MEGLFTETNRATERVLAGERLRARERARAALLRRAARARRRRSTRRAALARRQHRGVRERRERDYIVVNAAGCGAMMKEYGHLLARRPGVDGARGGDVSRRFAT